MGNSREGFRVVQRVGFKGVEGDWEGYRKWLGKRQEQRMWGEAMSNGMVVMIEVILYCIGRR